MDIFFFIKEAGIVFPSYVIQEINPSRQSRLTMGVTAFCCLSKYFILEWPPHQNAHSPIFNRRQPGEMGRWIISEHREKWSHASAFFTLRIMSRRFYN